MIRQGLSGGLGGTALLLPIGAGDPEGVGGAVVVEVAGENEEVVGEPVGVDHRQRIDRLLLSERRDQPLGAADHRAREVQGRRSATAAGQNE